MATTVKEILIEGLVRSNLVPRKRAVPADMLQNAYRLFVGILQKYNFSNFISFARNDIEIHPTDDKIELAIENINNISSIVYKDGIDYNELRFVAYEQFFQENSDYVYTWKYTDNNNIEIYLKPRFVAQNKTIKVIFNKELSYSLDDELSIPQVYEELFICSLTYKLALAFPRMDANQIAILKGELDDIEKTVKQNISSNKIITRNCSGNSMLSDFISGNFIFR